MNELSEFFGEQSPLQAHLPGFKPRPGQAWMAEAVAAAIADLDRLVVEAGTGTGKTFAYLLPALLSGRRTIISTGTKALQDQLYHRDLPMLGKVIGRPVATALLKGRANYLCLQRLDQLSDVGRSLRQDLAAVNEWRHRTSSGDRAELTEVAEDSRIWPLVTSTVDNCLGQKCPEYASCHVVKARRAAQEADLVVVNHHLLLADLAMKEAGFVEFLPGAEAIILDEAHQIPELAVQFFGVSLGSRELERLLEEIRAATVAIRQSRLQQQLDAFQTALQQLRVAVPRQEGKHQLADILPTIAAELAALQLALGTLQESLLDFTESSLELEQLHTQLLAVLERLSLLASDESWDGLRWLEVNARSWRFNLTPLDVSATLRNMVSKPQQAWIFTSATLAVGEDFSHFLSRMGLDGTTALTFPSPYALAENGLVYLPPALPEPSDPLHTSAAMEAVAKLLPLSPGGVFCLFTSHRALQNAAQWWQRNTSWLAGRELLVQGSMPRDELLRLFRDRGNAVLLGTGSFWEGVDVRGQALSMVVIDKLPFGSPADPMMMARLEYIRREGGNGFVQHQLPQAVLAMKQGAGRLLRDHADYGVIVLCDPRLSSKSYGRTFLKSFAPMPTTSSLDEVVAFFARHEHCEEIA